MKYVVAGCVISLIIPTSLLAADAPVGPSRPDWPPPGGYASPAGSPEGYSTRPVQATSPTANTYPQGRRSAPGYRYSSYRRDALVLPPGADWPDADYDYIEMPPPQPGYGVQVIPPPGIPLEGDIMNTTPRPVRHWRPLRGGG